MSDRSNNANNEEVIELENSVSKANENCAHDFKNDHDKEDVVDSLNHSNGKEGAGFYKSLECEKCSENGYSKEQNPEKAVENILEFVDEAHRNKGFIAGEKSFD